MMSGEQIPVIVTKSPDYRIMYSDGAIGGADPYDFRLIFYIHSPRYPEDPKKRIEVVERVLHTELILSFKTLVELRNWLDLQVKKLEEDGLLAFEKKK
jgi:hypothetical protein